MTYTVWIWASHEFVIVDANETQLQVILKQLSDGIFDKIEVKVKKSH